MDLPSSGVLALQIASGLALAACAGLRAFLPLFVVGLAGRFDLVRLSESMDWLVGTPALTVFGVAVVAELAGDKIPVVDHVLDVLQSVVKPAAGALLTASVVTDWDPLYLTVAAIVTGGVTSGVVHLAKAKLRVVSTLTTAGLGNPLVSLAEDAGALVGTAVALIAPLLLLLCFAVLVVWVLLRLRRRAAAAQSSP